MSERSKQKIISIKQCAIPDDDKSAALKLADWAVLAANVEVAVHTDHLADKDPIAERQRISSSFA